MSGLLQQGRGSGSYGRRGSKLLLIMMMMVMTLAHFVARLFCNPLND
jgi:hypothetical protein|eukprot:COSAG01_NODE_5850_length_3994_cov_5.826958_1_plen_47_part_00